MIVTIMIETYPSFTEWIFLTAMSATTTTTKNRVKSHKGNSTKYTTPTPAPTSGNTDNDAQRD